nr:hypothetical protein BaRGS_026469 [Batillaria attramentaria]
MCDSDCACQTGYECYRKVTGACCAPRTCITQAEAQADRDFWRCHPPPPRKRSADTPRSALFDALCPQLFPMAPGGGLQPAIAP